MAICEAAALGGGWGGPHTLGDQAPQADARHADSFMSAVNNRGAIRGAEWVCKQPSSEKPIFLVSR